MGLLSIIGDIQCVEIRHCGKDLHRQLFCVFQVFIPFCGIATVHIL